MRRTFLYVIICLAALMCAVQVGCTAQPPAVVLEIPDLAWETEPCDPNMMCSNTIACFEGELYPTSCGPLNCDEPIGPCE